MPADSYDDELARENAVSLKYCAHIAEETTDSLRKLFELMGKDDKIAVQAIGVELNHKGGFSAMREVYDEYQRVVIAFVQSGKVEGEFAKTVMRCNLRMLDHYWSGIGQWVD